MSNNIFNPDFEEYIELLNKYKVEYILVGGMAVNIYGYRRTTGDMDLFVNPTKENHKKIIKVHNKFGMHLGEMAVLDNFLDTQKYDVYTFGVSPVQIDIMTACKGVNFNDAYKQVFKAKIDNGIDVNVINYGQLLEAKRASGRTRDKADIEELERIKSSNKGLNKKG